MPRYWYLLGLSLFLGCNRAPLTIFFDQTSVRMGDEVHVMVEGAPRGWTGTLTVNGARRFQIDSKLNAVRVNSDNGFHGADNALKINDLGFHLRVTVPEFKVAKEMDQIGEEGGEGSVGVQGPEGVPLVIRGVPWVRTVAEAGGVRYAVEPNRSSEPRSAAILIGDATYFINQDPATSVHVPFGENFFGLPTPVWELRADGYSPTRWAIEDFEKGRSVAELSSEGREGVNSLIVHRESQAKEAWQSQVYLTRIDTERGGRYRAEFWAKAENPGPLSIIFSQRVAPYQPCGAIESVHVPAEWTQFSYEFEGGDRCGVDENRLSLYLGRLAGKVFLSKFSILRIN